MFVSRLPLFPLNVVLFPGMPLPLHVFEPRYQEMIRLCLDTDRTFGVALIRSGEEVGGPADPYSIGTTCEIVNVTPLDEGRMHLLTVGKQRFRILRLFQEHPYLEADVELLPSENEGELDRLPEEVRDLAQRYFRALLELGGQADDEVALPEDPRLLSYLLGATLRVPPAVGQELLEINETAERLRRQKELLRVEMAQIETLRQRNAQLIQPFRISSDDICLN